MTSSLLIHTALSQNPCLPDGISFATQAQVDSFSLNYPGCTEIEGSVYINSEDISNLNGLSQITAIGGFLKIFSTHQLSNLDGLDNLHSIGGECGIAWNNNLTSLSGLNSLKYVGGSLGIGPNPILADLDALDSLSYVGWNFAISMNDSIIDISLNSLATVDGSYFEISHNPHLNALSGFESLTKTNIIWIIDNVSMKSLTGFGNLEQVGLHLQITNNVALSDVSGFKRLKSIVGEPSESGLIITGNSDIEALNGFDSLSYVANDVEIGGNHSLTTLAGLGSLESVGGSLIIKNNSNLSNLDGLQSLSSIGNDLRIRENNGLSKLTGLENLLSVGGNLLLRGNDQLTDISGLNNIEPTTISNLFIFYNSSLSDCNIESVCNYLSAQGGPVSISENAEGCNSPEEVIDSCLTQITGNKVRNFTFKVYPNPSNIGYITCSVEGYNNFLHLNCYNTYGRKVYEKKTNVSVMEIDVSTWHSGIYYIEINADNKLQARSKFVIMK